jgi:leucyl-tRNA synthetase
LVLAPEHPDLEKVTAPEQRETVEEYRKAAAKKSELDRTALAKEKTGVPTGGHVFNPVNDERIPVWVADYVMMGYGTGAIMAVPAHDQRDFEFARKFLGDEHIRTVVRPYDKNAEEKHAHYVKVVTELEDNLTEEELDRSVSGLENLAFKFTYRVLRMKGVRGPALRRALREASAKVYFDDIVDKESGDFLQAFEGNGVCFNSPTREDAQRWIMEKRDFCTINDLNTPEAKKKITTWLEEKGFGKATVQYKLRDWLFSRQRYWGEPIPIVHCEKHGTVAVPESELPLQLPEMKDYTPTGNAEPPLAKATDWVNTKCPQCGGPAKRETNTMPQWAGSCWYYLRYIDPKNDSAFVAKDKEKYWMAGNDPDAKAGVDLYVGGAEHAVLHLLYSRFWHKVLFDLGHVSTPEPFMRLVNQGMILGELEFYAFFPASSSIQGFVSSDQIAGITEWVSADDVEFVGPNWLSGTMKAGGAQAIALKLLDGASHVEKRGEHYYLRSRPSIRVEAFSFKMSKSRGNVINPDDVVCEFGADTLRMYEMFMGPLDMVKPWSTRGAEGVYRFLGRVWRLFCDEDGKLLVDDSEPDGALLKILHQTIKKVGEDTEALAFNTAISQMMIFVNAVTAQEKRPRKLLEPFVLLLAPYAPHLAEEIWERLGHKQTLAYEPWPRFDESLLKEDTVTIVLQVNGKLRDRAEVPAQSSQAELEKLALANDRVKDHLAGKQVKKVIVVPGKLVNVVAS